MNNSKLSGYLRFEEGDATVPSSAGIRFIIHICNDIGVFGGGFTKCLQRKWPSSAHRYRMWYRNQLDFKRGNIMVVNVQSDITVIHMIAQKGIKPPNARPDLVDYDALELCLSKVAKLAKYENASIHMPRIGCDLAGSSWDKIEPLIQKHLVSQGLKVTVYDLPNS